MALSAFDIFRFILLQDQYPEFIEFIEKTEYLIPRSRRLTSSILHLINPSNLSNLSNSSAIAYG